MTTTATPTKTASPVMTARRCRHDDDATTMNKNKNNIESSSSRSPNCVILSLDDDASFTKMSDDNINKSTNHNNNDDDNDNDTVKKQLILDTDDNYNKLYPMPLIRDQILRINVAVGELSHLFLTHMPRDTPWTKSKSSLSSSSSTTTTVVVVDTPSSRLLAPCMIRLLELLRVLCEDLLSLNLTAAIYLKMKLNQQKYPAHLCKGKAGKYTEYSNHTGITKTQGQTTNVHEMMKKNHKNNHSTCSSSSGGSSSQTANNYKKNTAIPIAQLSQQLHEFALDREWNRYHTPRNLLLALTGELGELAELVQWYGDDDEQEEDGVPIPKEKLDKLGQEIADVTIYLIRLATVAGVDLEPKE